jgi:hypothetical protein
VAHLLGFRPTRHAPLGAGETLYAAPADDQAGDEENEDEASTAGYADPMADG